MAAWGNGSRLSLSPTSQLNIEPEGKCSTHRDDRDHTQRGWKVAYCRDSLNGNLRGRCNVTFLVCATGTSCLLSHTRANTDEHSQTWIFANTCMHSHTPKKNPTKPNKSLWWCNHFRLADSNMGQLSSAKTDCEEEKKNKIQEFLHVL